MARIVSNVPFTRGTEAADEIFGGPASNTIEGVGGDDLIFGLGGFDIINGGRDNDQVFGGAGDDQIVGGFTGNDLLDGGVGNDILFGQDENDVLHGGPGNDTLGGDVGDDVLLGESGSDSFSGGGGDDLLVDGDADGIFERDNFAFNFAAIPVHGNDVIEDFDPGLSIRRPFIGLVTRIPGDTITVQGIAANQIDSDGNNSIDAEDDRVDPLDQVGLFIDFDGTRLADGTRVQGELTVLGVNQLTLGTDIVFSAA